MCCSSISFLWSFMLLRCRGCLVASRRTPSFRLGNTGTCVDMEDGIARAVMRSNGIGVGDGITGVLSGWFFWELWDLCRAGTGSGPGGVGQLSLKLIDGRFPGEMRKPCLQTIIGVTWATSWGSGFGLISGPFGRRLRDSFSI